jgi:hypothetical protein
LPSSAAINLNTEVGEVAVVVNVLVVHVENESVVMVNKLVGKVLPPSVESNILKEKGDEEDSL